MKHSVGCEIEKYEKLYDESKTGVEPMVAEKITNYLNKMYDPLVHSIRKEDAKEKLLQILKENAVQPLLSEKDIEKMTHDSLQRAQQFLVVAAKIRDKQAYVDFLGNEELVSKWVFV